MKCVFHVSQHVVTFSALMNIQQLIFRMVHKHNVDLHGQGYFTVAVVIIIIIIIIF